MLKVVNPSHAVSSRTDSFTFWADNRGQDSELRIRAVPRVSLGQRLLASVFARGRSHSQGLNATDTLQNGDTLPLNQ